MPRLTLPSLALIILVPALVEASPITNVSGLFDPDVILTFSEVALADETPLTTQFASFGAGLGVTFSNLFYETSLAIVATAPYAENFPSACPGGGLDCDPFSIFFTSAVTDAAFQMVTNPGTSTFNARLNGALVESFSVPTALVLSTYYGFTGILFDQIEVIPGGFNQAAGIDNLEFATSAQTVPEPAAVTLLGLGLILAARRRRFRTSVMQQKL